MIRNYFCDYVRLYLAKIYIYTHTHIYIHTYNEVKLWKNLIALIKNDLKQRYII